MLGLLLLLRSTWGKLGELHGPEPRSDGSPQFFPPSAPRLAGGTWGGWSRVAAVGWVTPSGAHGLCSASFHLAAPVRDAKINQPGTLVFKESPHHGTAGAGKQHPQPQGGGLGTRLSCKRLLLLLSLLVTSPGADLGKKNKQTKGHLAAWRSSAAVAQALSAGSLLNALKNRMN